MVTNGEYNVAVKEDNTIDNTKGNTKGNVETLEQRHANLLKKANEICEGIRMLDKNVNDTELVENVNDRGNERVVEEDVIEVTKGVDVFQDIDDADGVEKIFEYGNESNVVSLDAFGNIENTDVVVGEKRKAIVCEDEEGNVSEEEDSEDESYMALTGSSDTEESVEDDFQVSENVEDAATEDDEEDLGLQNDDGPMEERDGLIVNDGSSSKPFFMLGMTFVDKKELRRAIDRYAIANGVNVKIVRSEKRLVKAVCEVGCPFTLYASKDGLNVGFKVKTLHFEHRCARVYKNQRASASWLAEHFKEKLQERPQYSINDMKKDVERELKVHVSIHKCKRAKRKIIQDMDGSFKDEFAKLEAYCNELHISNSGSDVIVEISNEALE